MDSLEEYVINHSSCVMPRCIYVENGIEIDCNECQKRMIAEHDAKIRADERAKVLEKVLKILANEKWDYTLVNKIEQLKEKR